MLSVANTMLQSAEGGIQPIILTFRELFLRYAERIHVDLIDGRESDGRLPPKYSYLRSEPRVRQKITQVFARILEQRLNLVRKAWNDEILILSSHMEVDLPCRFFMGYLATPLVESLVPSKEQVTAGSFVRTAESKQMQADMIKIINPVKIEPAAGAYSVTSDPTSVRLLNKRQEQKREAIRSFRHVIREVFHPINPSTGLPTAAFSAADAAVGGVFQPILQEKGDPDVEFLKSAGREYYYFEISMVAFKAELQFKHYLFQALAEPHESLQGEMKEEMLALSSIISTELQEAGNIHRQKNQLEKMKEKASDLESSIASLKTFLRVSYNNAKA